MPGPWAGGKEQPLPAGARRGPPGAAADLQWLAAYKDRSELHLDGFEGYSTLRLTDKKGTSAVIGHAGLEKTVTWGVEQRPASSIVLFNKDGKVIWQAP